MQLLTIPGFEGHYPGPDFQWFFSSWKLNVDGQPAPAGVKRARYASLLRSGHPTVVRYLLSGCVSIAAVILWLLIVSSIRR